MHLIIIIVATLVLCYYSYTDCGNCILSVFSVHEDLAFKGHGVKWNWLRVGHMLLSLLPP